MNRKKTTPKNLPLLLQVEAKQQPVKKDWQDSSKELRIRNFDPALKKELHEIMRLNPKKMPFESYAVEHLIRNYRADQNLIKQVQQRNTQLHAAMLKLQQRENDVRTYLSTVTKYLVAMDGSFKKFMKLSTSEAKRLTAVFKGTVKASRKAAGTKPRAKTVPKKKGGKK